MQLTRKNISVLFVIGLGLLCLFNLAGHPLLPAEALAGLGALPMAMAGEMDIKSIKDLLDKQGTAWEEFKKTNDASLQSKADGKAVSEFEAKLTKINAAIQGVEDELKAIAKKAARPGTGGAEQDPVQAEYKKAFSEFMRKGDDDGLAELEAKAYNLTTPADGGFAVPEELDRNILDLLVDISPIRGIANVITVGSSNYKKLVNIHGTSSGWVDEDDPRTATNSSQLTAITPFMGEIYAFPQATQQMLDDVFFNAEKWIEDECTLEFSQKEGAAFVVGDGVKKPKGFLAYPTAATADGVRAFGTIEHVPTGVAGDWAAANKSDIIISMVHKIKQGMRTNASWVTSKALLAEIRTFKNADGDYIWRPGLEAGQPSTLSGYMVTEAEDMPAKAANSLSLAFGNFKRGYTIVDRIGTRILRDPYTNKPYVGFYVTKRVGGMLVDSQAIKVVKFAVA